MVFICYTYYMKYIDIFEKENNELFALIIICYIYGLDFKMAYNRDRPDLQINTQDISLGIEVTIALDQKSISNLKLLQNGKYIYNENVSFPNDNLVINAINKKIRKVINYSHDFASLSLFIYYFEVNITRNIFDKIANIENLADAYDYIYLFNFSDIYIYDCKNKDIKNIHLNFFALKKLFIQLQKYISE